MPVGRWKGFGGVTNFNGPGFETFSWAAGVGACTSNSAVFATSHVLTVHPIMAAKQATTIDHITGGRFALNVVTGWHRPEMEMFGAPLMEHDDRYELAVEWLEIIKRLWTEDGGVRFRRPALQDQQGLSRAEAVAEAVSAGHERRQLGERPRLRDPLLRHRLRQSQPRRPLGLEGGDRGLPQARPRGVRPRAAGLVARLHRARRDRGGGQGLFRRIRPPQGRLGGGDQPGRHHGAEHAKVARRRRCAR